MTELNQNCGSCGRRPPADGHCLDCTYWVEGVPCVNRAEVLAEVRLWVAAGFRDTVSAAISEYALDDADLWPSTGLVHAICASCEAGHCEPRDAFPLSCDGCGSTLNVTK